VETRHLREERVKLQDRVCVITGGGTGIGEAIARRFAVEGATVAIWDVDSANAERVGSELGGSGCRCDVSVRASVQDAFDATIRVHGRIDVLVNNAGVAIAGPSETFSDADWNTSIGIMQTGVFLASQIVGRHMLARNRGSIVNIASINAWEAFPLRLAYCAAKAAVVSMTDVLAIEWADRGVRVNAVAPGVTRTALVQKGIDEGVVDVERYTARTPLHRFGEPDEIARAVLFLANDEDSSFTTGTTLRVDGGWSAMGWIVTASR
jgi:NAD(P)-dependent dehydrogenase (short-subunit alcohol dehydrogenase family)